MDAKNIQERHTPMPLRENRHEILAILEILPKGNPRASVNTIALEFEFPAYLQNAPSEISEFSSLPLKVHELIA